MTAVVPSVKKGSSVRFLPAASKVLNPFLSGTSCGTEWPAPAQDLEEPESPGPIITDRPTDSASPLLVPARLFQFELGYKLSRINSGQASTDTQLFPDLLARYGIDRKVEARLVAAGWSFQSGDGAGSDGFSDVSLGAKIHLAEERRRSERVHQTGLLDWRDRPAE